MKIYKTIVATTDEEGEIIRCDTIEHEGALWLVPEWLRSNSGGSLLPARIIRISEHPHQRIESGEPADFVLNGPVPKGLLYDRSLPPEAGAYVVIEYPDIECGSPGGVQ